MTVSLTDSFQNTVPLNDCCLHSGKHCGKLLLAHKCRQTIILRPNRFASSNAMHKIPFTLSIGLLHSLGFDCLCICLFVCLLPICASIKCLQLYAIS